MRLISILCCVAAMTLAAAAQSAPATPEEAQAVKAALERYTGSGSPNQPSAVSVTPEADHYAIAIDLKQAFRALAPLGLTVDSATYALSATPQDGGTWHVTSTNLPRVTAKHGDETYSVVINAPIFDGVFDPKIPGFKSSSLAYTSLSIAALGGKNGDYTRQVEGGKQSSTTTPTADGIANLQTSQTNTAYAQDITLAAPPKGGSVVPGRVSFKSGPTSDTLTISNLHVRALTDLWAFFVAHPNEPAMVAAQTDFRDLLRRALPLFDLWSQGGSVEHLAVDSPVGAFAADSVAGQIEVTGLVAQGRLDTQAKVDGLTLPSELTPEWAAGLLPTNIELKQSFAGFHLGAAAREAIDTFDLNASKPLKPDEMAKLKAMVGPLDQMILTLAPSHIVSKLLDIHFDGDARFTQPLPDFHLNVRASGIEKAMQDVQSKAGGDMSAMQVLAVMVLAKGLGHAEPDGTMTWAVTKAGTGRITVNGLDLPGAGGK